MAKPNTPDTPSVNLLGAGTSIKGDIKSNGDIRIDGSLSGSIHSKGKVIIGETGRVEGEIICKNADISGEIKAQLIVSDLLTLKSTAKFYGDITTGKLAIESGAAFTGTCKMDNTGVRGDSIPSNNEGAQRKEKIA